MLHSTEPYTLVVRRYNGIQHFIDIGRKLDVQNLRKAKKKRLYI